MDEVVLEGKTYIGSKKAALECGYTQDYVGQLCRGGQIDAKRVSGQWYIFLESLQGYKTKAETFKPEPPKYQPDPNVEATLNLDGKEYVSAARAAKITEYNQDYVGQLARAGKIPSRQIGNRWYVEHEALIAHKKEKDAMLRAVQAESVGLVRPQPVPTSIKRQVSEYKHLQPLLVYKHEEQALFPQIAEEGQLKAVKYDPADEGTPIGPTSKIPIKVLRTLNIPLAQESEKEQKERFNLIPQKSVSIPRKAIFGALLWPATVSIILVLAVGLGTYKRDTVYSYMTGSAKLSQPASVRAASKGIGDMLEQILTKQLKYDRN